MVLMRDTRNAVLGVKLFGSLSIGIENNLLYFHCFSEYVLLEKCIDRSQGLQKEKDNALPDCALLSADS